MKRKTSFQRLVAVSLLLWLNLVVCISQPTFASSWEIQVSKNNFNSHHMPPLEEAQAPQEQARSSPTKDPSQRRDASMTTSSAAAATSGSSSGLNGFISQIIDAFSCVGNASDILKGFENLLNGLDADTTFVTAIESALFGDYTPFQVPAFFLGIGVGEASIVGLNATDADRANGYRNRAVAASGANDTGINDLALEFGRGLVNVTLPPILDSSAEDFLAGVSLGQFVEGAGLGAADGVGLVLKPILGTDFFDVSVNNTGNFGDPKGAGALAYSFARGLASQLTSLGLGFLGVGNASTVPILKRQQPLQPGMNNQDRVMRSFLGGRSISARHIRMPTQNADSQLPDPVLLNSTKTSQLTSSLAQLAVSELSCKGVGGAIAVFTSLLSDDPDAPVPTIPNLGEIHLPDVKVVVRSSGNLFEIGLKNMSATVNGVDIYKMIGLLAAHIVFTLIAFLGLFPTVLIVEAIERLAIAIRRPINPVKMSRFIKIVQVGIIPLLAIVGLIVGVLGGGNSRHFRTPHGILGLVLTILVLVCSGLSFLRRRRMAATLNHAARPVTKRTGITLIETLAAVLVMALIFATWVTGLEDLRALSLCIVDQISITVMSTVASLISALWDSAVTIVVVEWWLGRRLSRTVERGQESGSVGSGEVESAKEGRARHVDVLDKAAQS